MYNESKRGGLLKEFIMKLVLIIIFVLLLLWVIPWKSMTNALDPLKDQIFNANLQTMKEAGISYFTSERLPENVGDVTTLSLQKMLDLKLLVPFTDKNGDSCDVTASYVSLEKKDTEFVMKVNLKCGEQEDYILVHLGCYSYCQSAICEAKKGNTEKSSTVVKQVKKEETTQVKQQPQQQQQTAQKATERTITQTQTQTQTVIVNVPTPTPTPVPTNPNPTPTPIPTPKPVVNKEYEYLKTTKNTINHNAEYSNWSSWETKTLKKNETIPKSTNTYQVEDLGYKRIEVGKVSAVYEDIYTVHYEMKEYSTLTYKVCDGYSYVADQSTVYRVDSNWIATNEYKSGYRSDIPYDTLDTRWVFQSVDYNVCKENCTSNPYATYRKYVRKLGKNVTYTNVGATCTSVVDKAITTYVSTPVARYQHVKKSDEQTLYGTIHQYRTRTRSLIKDAYSETKISTSSLWSTYNDTSLLSQGYFYTGKTRDK